MTAFTICKEWKEVDKRVDKINNMRITQQKEQKCDVSG
jgi:hypothetical protein